MKEKNNKIINFNNFKDAEKDTMEIDFFESIYELTNTFENYLKLLKKLQMFDYGEVILLCENEIRSVVKITKDVCELEQKKTKNVIEVLPSHAKKLMSEWIDNISDLVNGFYNVYLRVLNEKESIETISGVEYITNYLEIELCIINFLIECVMIMELYLLFNLSTGYELQKTLDKILIFRRYEFSETATVYEKGIIRESNTAKSKKLCVVSNNDFFIVNRNANVKLYYKVKFYNASKNAIIDGFILKKDVLLFEGDV